MANFAILTNISSVAANLINPNNTDILFQYNGYASPGPGGLGNNVSATICPIDDEHTIELKIIQAIIDDVYVSTGNTIVIDIKDILIPKFVRNIS